MQTKNFRTDTIVFALCIVGLISIFVSVIFNVYYISRSWTESDLDGIPVSIDRDEFATNGKCVITERWEYYDGVHIISGGTVKKMPDAYVELPMRWSMFDRQSWGSGGKASYRIELENLPEEDLIFCLYGISPAVELYIDGVLQQQNYYSRALQQGDIRSSDHSEIVIELSSEWLTGVYACPWLYRAPLFQRDMNIANSIWMASMGSFITAFLLCTVILRKFNAKKQYRGFILSFICIALFYVFTSNEMTSSFHSLYKYVNFEQMHLLVTALAVMLGCSVVHLQRLIFPKVYDKALTYSLAGMLFASMFLRLILDLYCDMDIITICLLAMFLVYEIICTFLAIGAEGREVVYISGATVMITMAVSATSIASARYYYYGVYVIMPLALIVAILCYANFWALRVAQMEEAAANERLAKEKLMDAEIAYLTSQVQPHFQYNTLTLIQELCYTEPEKAAEAIVKYSSLLRRKVDFARQARLIPFDDELESIENYIAIQKLRFNDVIRFEMDIETTDFQVPPLSVQTLIENSVHHGLRKKPDGGVLKLSVKRERGFIRVRVSDNGVGFSPDQCTGERTGSGIENCRYRVETLLGGTLDIKSSSQSGSCVTISIPRQRKRKRQGDKRV